VTTPTRRQRKAMQPPSGFEDHLSRRQAAEVLGHDPRQVECSENAAKGSLGHVVAQAEQVVRDANDAAARLAAIGAETRELIPRLERRKNWVP